MLLNIPQLNDPSCIKFCSKLTTSLQSFLYYVELSSSEINSQFRQFERKEMQRPWMILHTCRVMRNVIWNARASTSILKTSQIFASNTNFVQYIHSKLFLFSVYFQITHLLCFTNQQFVCTLMNFLYVDKYHVSQINSF